MQKIATLTLSILLAAFTANAQQFDLIGKVKIVDGRPIEAITLSLLKAEDSSWVRSELTDDTGTFHFKNMASGKYLLHIQTVGYEKLTQPLNVNKSVTIPDILLKPSSQSLKEVVVNGKLPFIQNELGKTIVNVEQSLTNVGSNVLEILKKAPGVVVDGNGNISMQGKQGVLILIDGKQTYLSGDQLTEYLKGMSADMVAKLELITQPSAKYDAEGNAGIINIRSRKNKKQGFNGTNIFTASQGVYPYIGNTTHVNYKKGKVNFFADGGHYRATGYLRQRIDRTFTDVSTGNTLSTFSQNGFNKEKFRDYNLRLGADANASDKTTMGASVQGVYHPNNEVDRAGAVIHDNTTNTDMVNSVLKETGFLRKNVIANAYLKQDLRKDEDLSIDIDYANHSEHSYQNLQSRNYDSMLLAMPAMDLILNDLNPVNTEAYSIKADYSRTSKGGLKTEAGVKTALAKVYDANNFMIDNNGVWQQDTTRTNHFLYTELISAAYLNFNKRLGNKWHVQAGLRAEQLNAEGKQLTQAQSFTKDKLSLFPTAFIGYKLNDKNQLELNYGKRINRPYYNYLNPFISYVSQYNYQTGNPQLQPEYTHNIEIKHTFDQKLITVVRYNIVSGIMSDIYRYDASTKTTYMTIENIAKKIGYGISGSYNQQLFDWWLLASSWDIYDRIYEAEINNNKINFEGVAWGFGIDNQFTFKKGWNAEVQYYYGGRSTNGIYSISMPTHWFGFGVSKKVLKDAGTVKLDISDPLFMYRTREEHDWPGMTSQSNVKYATQNAALSLSYNFGRNNENKQRQHDKIEEATRMGM